jgi:hypothetical protein
MKTYTDIQTIYKDTYGTTIKSCWIADAKRELGLTRRIAYNRSNVRSVKYPCPNADIKNRIIEIIRS